MSWQNAVLSAALRYGLKPRTAPGRFDLPGARRLTERPRSPRRPPPGWLLRGLPGGHEWLLPQASGPADGTVHRTIYYLHGGAYIGCSPRTHRILTDRLACEADAQLYSLDYRLAPEHPFPAALDDAVAGYQRLLDAGIEPASIVLAGDSAGGGLALATLVALRDEGMPLPAGAVLFSPWTDLTASGESAARNNDTDVMFTAEGTRMAASLYVADTPADHPLASPLFSALHGLPPLLVQASDSEVLLDDAVRLATRVRDAGGRAELNVWTGLPHAWQIFCAVLPEARLALRQAADFIRGLTP
ncbi:alpha/beta hydrolase [Chitinasiproducens palmae]|uniref:Acetyl esterase/lipase n=1 Tax=Chitinasiproducens palmae TaxID=1770053 RepID=A0A1H2PNE0_9BURK|nr:alpha/beta hydrolase [Chitinasiproducens palmae]SDV48184.1 Acetyl esterase/lipase [Chitinasiproducens palmae]